MAYVSKSRQSVIAFALGLSLVVAGCTVSMTVDPRTVVAKAPAPTTAPAKPRSPEYLPESMFADAAAPKAPVVNVFGEFSRARRGTALAADVALRQHTFVDAGYDADVTVDPTGRWMVYSGSRDDQRTQIFVQPVEGGDARQLIVSAADDAQPCFSPDGKRIAFCSNRTGTWQVFVMNTDGSQITQVTQGDANAMHPTFSPGGERLAYASLPATSTPAGGQWELWTADLKTREQRMIGYGLFPAWSPRTDRDVIAFQKTRARGSRWFSLWTCELRDGEATQITEVAVSANAALVSPCWSPDGKSLAFASIVDPAQTRGGKPQGQQDVWVMAADGSNRRRLTDGTTTNLTPSWAVDNHVYFVSDRSGHECIWSLPAGKNGADGTAMPVDEPRRNASANSDTTEIRP